MLHIALKISFYSYSVFLISGPQIENGKINLSTEFYSYVVTDNLGWCGNETILVQPRAACPSVWDAFHRRSLRYYYYRIGLGSLRMHQQQFGPLRNNIV